MYIVCNIYIYHIYIYIIYIYIYIYDYLGFTALKFWKLIKKIFE